MTPLNKPVRRKTVNAYPVLFAGRPRQIIASFVPTDLIEFREAGRREKFYITIDGAFRAAVRLKAESIRREKIQARKARKKGRA